MGVSKKWHGLGGVVLWPWFGSQVKHWSGESGKSVSGRLKGPSLLGREHSGKEVPKID